MKFTKQMMQCAIAASCLLLGAACCRVPVTGRLQLAFHDQHAPQPLDNDLALARKAGAVDYDLGIHLHLQRIARRLQPAVSYYDHNRHATGWSAHVVLGEEANATAQARGRRIYLTGRLAEMHLSDAELAAVLAHETGHLVANHIAEKATAITIASRLLGYQADRSPSNLLNAILRSTVNPAVELLYLHPLERLQELEADRIGMYILARAGYDPHAMAHLLKKITRLDPNPQIHAVLTGHPADAARIQQAESLMPKLMPIYHHFVQHR